MAFVHRRAKSENDKSVAVKVESIHVSDYDYGREESSDDEDIGREDQAPEPRSCPAADENSRHCHRSQLVSSATVLGQSTQDNCVPGWGPGSGLSHANNQAYYGQCYYPTSTLPLPYCAHPVPVPFPAYGHHDQIFYPISEEAAGLHWQQHGGEERNPRASTAEHGEEHAIRGRRIYLGNLRYTATAEGVRQHLNHHGFGQGVETIFMARAGRGRNRGFCFVTYDSPDRAKEAMEHLGGSEHMGRKLICRASLPRGMHYEPNASVGPGPKDVSQAQKHDNSDGSSLSPHSRPAPHRIPFEDVGADDYVMPPYDAAKIFSPKRDWISAGACVLEVANLPPMPGEGACLREMECLFEGFDVVGICGPIPQYWCDLPFSPNVAANWCPDAAHFCNPQYCYVRFKTKAQAQLAAQQLHSKIITHGRTLRRLYVCARWSLSSTPSI